MTTYKAGVGIAVAAGMGAGLMYFLDPNRGKARRAVTRDKATKLYHDGLGRVEHTVLDLENRVHGIAHEAGTLLHPEPVDDDVLVARVRAKLGRLVARPHRVEVAAKDGHVTLAGQVRHHEPENLVLAVRAMHGVKDVENNLVVRAHEVSKGLPGAVIAALAGVSTLLIAKAR